MGAIKQQSLPDNILLTNLHELMRERNCSAAELSRATNIPAPTLHKLLSGKTEDPRVSTLKTLADYFDVSLEALYTRRGVANTKSDSASKTTSIPVISWESCVSSNKTLSQLTPDNWELWVPINTDLHHQAYGLISKPSMEPTFPRGTTLIVDPETKPVDGDYVVVRYPDTNEATLRELSLDGPTTLLLPLNQTMTADQLDKSIKILGVVVQSRFSYTP